MSQRVLLVDDEPAIRECFASILQGEGLLVETAESTRAALALLSRLSFDLVVTDLQMETSTAGFDVARWAARQPYKPAVLILTAFPVPANTWKHAGADALVVKGGDVSSLLSTIASLLQVRQPPLVQTEAGQTKHRAVKRLSVKRPAKVHNTETQRSLIVTTCDISSRGVFFLCPQELAVGSAFEMTVVMPPEMLDLANKWVKCDCQVVRVDVSPGSSEVGIAAIFRGCTVLPET
jgi:CheY-like chemotaxis protein